MAQSDIPLPLPPKKRAARKNSAPKRWGCFFGALLIGGFLCWGMNRGQISLENYFYAQISGPINDIVLVIPNNRLAQNMELRARAALSFRISPSGREKIIFQKNIDEVLPIASLSKLMAAQIVLDYPEIYNLSKIAVISPLAAAQEDVPVSGNLMPFEARTIKDLLGLMLFYSSNDAAFALAEKMGVDEFVAKMNEKSAKIGLEKTEFFNATGLDLDDGRANVSTARELMAMAKYILGNYPEIFFEAKTAGAYRPRNGIFDFHLWDGQNLIGGKTGYTKKAGGCMISAFEDEQKFIYINILLGAPDSETRVAEMQKLVNFANNY